MPTLDRIAKTIVGPNEAHHVGPAKLLELQDLKWGRLKSQEQSHFLRAARYVLELFESEPDGYVILNGDNTRARAWHLGPVWTADLGTALQFARRADAEQFAHDDEDAWCVQRVSEARAVWASRAPAIVGPNASNAAPVAQERRAHPLPPPLPGAALLPPDDRSTEHLLFLLRGFCNRNVVTWMNGAGDHHHPIWADIAAELHQYDLNYYPTNGPDYLFIQPLNRVPHAVIQQDFVEKGGNIA